LSYLVVYLNYNIKYLFDILKNKNNTNKNIYIYVNYYFESFFYL